MAVGMVHAVGWLCGCVERVDAWVVHRRVCQADVLHVVEAAACLHMPQSPYFLTFVARVCMHGWKTTDILS